MASDVQKLNKGPVEATPAIVLPLPGTNAPTRAPVTDVVVTPTQVRRPWRSTTRTIVQALIALATLLPFVLTDVYESPDAYPAVVVQLLVVAGIVTRLMANPHVEEFLRRFLPFLAAAPSPVDERPKDQRGVFDVGLTFTIAAGIFLAWIAIEIVQRLLING